MIDYETSVDKMRDLAEHLMRIANPDAKVTYDKQEKHSLTQYLMLQDR